MTLSPRYIIIINSVDPIRLLKVYPPTIDLDSPILESDAKNIRAHDVTELYFVSAWTSVSFLVYLHGDYVSVQYNGGFIPDFLPIVGVGKERRIKNGPR